MTSCTTRALGYALAMGMVVILGDHAPRLPGPAAALGALAPMTEQRDQPARSGHRGDAGRVARPARGARAQVPVAVRLVGRSSSSASSTSSCRWSATFAFSLRAVPFGVGLHGHPRGPEVLREPGLFVRRRAHHDRHQHRAHRPDRLLGPAAPAARSTDRRVRDAAAVRHPADRPRVRPHPASTAARRCRSPTPTSGAPPCSSAATSCCRSRTCTGRSTRACGRWTSGA